MYPDERFGYHAFTWHTSGSRIGSHLFAPALATRSGALPWIGIYWPQHWQHDRGLCLELASIRPNIGNMLNGCSAPTLRTRRNICVKCYSLDQW
jgi:hypothetical protein